MTSAELQSMNRVETECHTLEVAVGNISGMSVVESRGVDYLGHSAPVTRDGIERRTHEWFCRRCRKRLCVDEARTTDRADSE